VAPFGHPSGADPDRFHLIAPTRAIRANGRSCPGSMSIRRSGIGSAHRCPARRDRSRA
jgi:hypothetical protein